MTKGTKASQETRKRMSVAHKGIKFTEQHRRRISAALIGKKKRAKTMEERIKISMAITGEQHFNGFKSHENRRFRASKEYKEWRDFIFRRDNYTCTKCRTTGGYLEAHHRLPLSLFPEYRLYYVNGSTVCRPCHKQTESYQGKAKRLKRTDYPMYA